MHDWNEIKKKTYLGALRWKFEKYAGIGQAFRYLLYDYNCASVLYILPESDI